MRQLCQQQLLAALEVPGIFCERDQRAECSIGGHRENAAIGTLVFLESGFERVHRLVRAAVAVEPLGESLGDVQPVERALRGIAVQHREFAELLGRKRRLGKAEAVEEVRHEPRLPGSPFALEGPHQRGECFLGMRAGLILQVADPALDHQFQKV